MLLPVRKPRSNPAKAEPNGKTTSPQRRRERRVQCHGRTPWWKGMGNPEECPQEWGHGSLKGYATVLRRRINELRGGFRRDGCPLGRFRRPRRLRFPNKGFIVHPRPVRIAFAVTPLQSSDLQSPEVFSKRVANQRGAIPLGTMRGPAGRLQELRIENNLDGFHMWNLLRSILHTHGTGGFVSATRPWVRGVPGPGGLAEWNAKCQFT